MHLQHEQTLAAGVTTLLLGCRKQLGEAAEVLVYPHLPRAPGTAAVPVEGRGAVMEECLLSPLQRQRHGRLGQASERSPAPQPRELAQAVAAAPIPGLWRRQRRAEATTPRACGLTAFGVGPLSLGPSAAVPREFLLRRGVTPEMHRKTFGKLHQSVLASTRDPAVLCAARAARPTQSFGRQIIILI